MNSFQSFPNSSSPPIHSLTRLLDPTLIPNRNINSSRLIFNCLSIISSSTLDCDCACACWHDD